MAAKSRITGLSNHRLAVFGGQINDIGMFRVADDARTPRRAESTNLPDAPLPRSIPTMKTP